jgi:hypothetical protein
MKEKSMTDHVFALGLAIFFTWMVSTLEPDIIYVGMVHTLFLSYLAAEVSLWV